MSRSVETTGTFSGNRLQGKPRLPATVRRPGQKGKLRQVCVLAGEHGKEPRQEWHYLVQTGICIEAFLKAFATSDYFIPRERACPAKAGHEAIYAMHAVI